MPSQKSPMKHTPLALPVIGQSATSLGELLIALKDEYLYNTRVRV